MKNYNFKERRVNRGVHIRGVKRCLCLLALGCTLSTGMWAQHTTASQSAEPRNFTGKVFDSKDGSSLIGCTVRVKGKQAATITDADGNYSITASPGDILIISYVGYETVEVPVGSKKATQVYMVDDSVLMEDVVVTGYQTLKKFNVTGSVNTIKNDKIALRSSVGLEGILEGSVPGLNVYNDQFRIRGGASMNAGNDPLFIVDDFEVEELPENMDMIESITVLKDASATAIWGSRAANGVIVITTKKGKANDFKISYSNNFKVSAKPNLDDLHRATTEQIIDYDREAHLYGYNSMMGGFGYQGAGYSLSQEILNDYWEDVIIDWETGAVAPMDPQRLAEMDARLNKLKAYSNRKQIEDYLMRNAFRQQHMISVSGGTDRASYFLSGSFIGGHSEYVGDKERSYNINSRMSYKLLHNLTLRTDLSATFDNNDNGYTSLSSDIYNLFPFQMLTDEYGNRIADYTQFSHMDAEKYTKDYGYLSFGKNLLDEVDMANNTTKNTDYKARFGLDYRILEGLNISADYQYERYQSINKNIQSVNSYGVRELINQHTVIEDNGLSYRIPKGDILDHSQTDVESWTMKIGATLNRNFGADKQHYVNATAGFEARSKHTTSETYRKLGYNDQVLSWSTIDAIDLATNGTTPPWYGNPVRYYASTYDGFNDILNREISYYLSGVYTYDNRYTVSGSLRIDKSNLFGVSDKYRRNPIWSFGANWNIKNEKFFHCDAITALMLRASVGLTGNFDRSGRTSPVMIGQFINSDLVDGGGYMRISTPPNPLLRWERTRSVNLSVDFGLFDRVNTTLTYYHNKGYDLLGEAQLDPTVGYTEQLVNAADMNNTGIELQLDADIIRTRDFTWNVGWVFGYNKNEIIRNSAHDSDPVLNRVHGTTRFVEGYSREGIWSYRWAGLNEMGLPQAYKADGSKVTSYEDLDVEDLEYSGTYQPKYSGSLSTGFRYKNLQANFLFTYNFGHVFRVEYPDMNPFGSSPALNERIGERWRQPGDEAKTDIPAICSDMMNYLMTYQTGAADLAQYSSNSIRKGDMIRLREILLNYSLPKKWLRKSPVKQLSITAQLNNIWLWTANKEGYDPEAVSPVSGTFSLTDPIAFTCGVKLDF